MTFTSPKDVAVTVFGAIGTAVLAVLLFAVIFAFGWAVTGLFVALFLNGVGHLGLTFANVAGISGLLYLFGEGIRGMVKSS